MFKVRGRKVPHVFGTKEAFLPQKLNLSLIYITHTQYIFAEN